MAHPPGPRSPYPDILGGIRTANNYFWNTRIGQGTASGASRLWSATSGVRSGAYNLGQAAISRGGNYWRSPASARADAANLGQEAANGAVSLYRRGHEYVDTSRAMNYLRTPASALSPIASPPEALVKLKSYITKAIQNPDFLTVEDLKEIHTHLEEISTNDWALLKRLCQTNQGDRLLLQTIKDLFQNGSRPIDAAFLRQLKRNLAEYPPFRPGLKQLNSIVDDAIEKSKGFLYRDVMHIGDMIDQTITKTAHPLLAETHLALEALFNAFHKPDETALKLAARDLQRIIPDLLLRKGDVFAQKPLTEEHERFLRGFINQLARYPLRDREEMNNQIQDARLLLGKYYQELNGSAGRVADILQGKLGAMTDVVMDKVDKALNTVGHDLLQFVNEGLIQLRRAVIQKKDSKIRELSTKLQEDIHMMGQRERDVFTSPELPLKMEDRAKLITFLNQLSEFRRDVLPHYDTMLEQIEPVKEIISKYYSGYFKLGYRFGESIIRPTTERVFDGMDSLNSKLETVQQALGIAPQPAPAGRAAAAPAAAAAGNFGHFLQWGGSMLNNVLSKGGEALSGKAAEAMSSMLLWGMNQGLAQMSDSPAFAQPKAKLIAMINAFRNAQQNGFASWNTIWSQFKDLTSLADMLNITISGIRIPHFNSGKNVSDTSEAIYSENIDALREVMQPLAPAPRDENWKEMAEGERDKLVLNVSRFFTIKHIYEAVCGFKPPSEQFYMNLLIRSQAKGAEASETELKALFFEELSKKNIGFLPWLNAKFQFFIFSSILRRFASNAITYYFDTVFDYIEKNKGTNFESLRTLESKNMVRYLTILGGVYKKIAKKDDLTHTIDEMVLKELNQKDANLGHEVKDLYDGFAQEIIRKATGAGFWAWIVKKFFPHPEEMITALVDKTVGTLQDSGGYALNFVIKEQLDEVLRLLQEQVKQKDRPGDADPVISEHQREQNRQIVKALFEILPLTKSQTPGELEEAVKRSFSLPRLIQGVENVAFIEQIVEKATNLLALSIQSLAKSDQFYKLTYKFASLANRAFDVGQDYTLEQRREVENQVPKLGSQILRLSVSRAVEDYLDFSGEVQQTETNRKIKELKDRAEGYIRVVGEGLGALSPQGIDFSTPAARNKIDAICDETLAFQTECDTFNFGVRLAESNSFDKGEIRKQYAGMAEQARPLVQTLSRMKLYSSKLEETKSVREKLRIAIETLRGIPLKLAGPGGATPAVLSACEADMQRVDTLLKDLRKISLNLDINKEREIQPLLDSPLIGTIANNAHALTRVSALTKARNDKIAELKVKIRSATPSSLELRERFSVQIKAIEDARDDAQVQAAMVAIRELLNDRAPVHANDLAVWQRLVHEGQNDALIRPIVGDQLELLRLNAIKERNKNHIEDLKVLIERVPVELKGPLSHLLRQIGESNLPEQIETARDKYLELIRKSHLSLLLSKISQGHHLIADHLISRRKIKEKNDFFAEQAQPNSLLNQVANEKKQHLVMVLSPELNTKFATLKTQIRTVFDRDGQLLPLLIGKIEAMENASTAAAVDKAYAEFLNLRAQATAIALNNADYNLIFREIEGSVGRSGLLDADGNLERGTREAIQRSIVAAQGHLRTFTAKKEEIVKQMGYLNYMPVDMKGALLDFVTQFVYSRVYERMEGLIKFVKREDTQRYGMLNHMFLIPYMEAQGKKA